MNGRSWQRKRARHSLQRSDEFGAQVSQVIGQEIGQIGALGVVPDLLGRMKFRSVGGEPFDPLLPVPAIPKTPRR